jgi:hypothetical protein
MDEIRQEKRTPPIQESQLDESIGKIIPLEDRELDQFYGSSTTQAYRLKSELVGKCMEEFGMGKFQWKLFVVTGFGWIVDNVSSPKPDS